MKLPGAPVGTTIRVRDGEVGTVGGALTVPIDLTGELRHTLFAAQAGYRGERARQWATTLDQQVAVIRAYFQLLEAERLREVTEQTLAVQRQQLTDAQNRYDVGQLTKNELLVVQVALRNGEQELLRRQLAIDQARWTLNDAVGLPVDAPTTVTDVGREPVLPDETEALRQAYRSNPALTALVEEQQRLQEAATALARGRLPRFATGGNVDYSTSDLLQPQRIESGWLGFTWDLGTDGRREAQIAEARIAADRNRLAVEQELRELEAAVRATRRAAAERVAALAAADAAVGQAEENLRIRRQQFQVGRATSDDVLDAERLLAFQRAARASALYQAHTRRAELQQLMGLSLDAAVPDQR
ncbi:MAG: TolC family protein [Candidatus Binatia bacterium]